MIGKIAKPKANKTVRQPIRTVWDDLYDDPATAAIMRFLSELIIALTAHIKARRWSKAAAAKRCGVSPARIVQVLRGSVTHFTADDLMGMLRTAGLEVGIQVVKATFGTTPHRPKGKGA